jgi:GDPmannose 4,6-dehydratase
VGSAVKIRQKLGWQPRTTFTDLVRQMVEAELKALAEQPQSS